MVFGGNVDNIEKTLTNMITKKMNIEGNVVSFWNEILDWLTKGWHQYCHSRWLVCETARHQVHLEENEPIELQQLWRQGHHTQPL